MKRIHPNLSRLAIGATIALTLGAGGCRSTSGVAGNPFLSPDRVPPPTTRALLPGQAQPYYQGDPLPPMQSAANPPANAVAADPLEADSRSSTGRTLAWAQPGSAAPAPTIAPPPQQQIAPANEALVAVPTDADPLRYPVPAPRELQTAAPIAAADPAPVSQPIQPVATQQQPGVLLASYNAPVAAPPPTPVSVPTIGPPQQVASPWRSPQVAQTAAPQMYGAPPVAMQPIAGGPLALPGVPTLPAPPGLPTSPVIQQPIAIPANTMAATLRAVSPPPAPGDPMPRVRVPGYVEPQISAADGFRPRTSMQ